MKEITTAKTQRIKLSQTALDKKIAEHKLSLENSSQSKQYKKLDLSDYTKDGVTYYYDCSDLRFPNDVSYAGVKFTGCVLQNCILTDCDLKGANFDGCDLSYANLFKAQINNGHIQNSILLNTNITEADLTGAEIINSLCLNMTAIKTTFNHAQIINCNLAHSNFMEAMISKALIQNSQVNRTIFTGASLDQTTFIDMRDLNRAILQKKSLATPSPTTITPLSNVLMLNTKMSLTQICQDTKCYVWDKTAAFPLFLDTQTLLQLDLPFAFHNLNGTFFSLERMPALDPNSSSPSFWLTSYQRKAFIEEPDTFSEQQKTILREYSPSVRSQHFTHWHVLNTPSQANTIPRQCSLTEIQTSDCTINLLTDSGYKGVIITARNPNTPPILSEGKRSQLATLHGPQLIMLELAPHNATITAHWDENGTPKKTTISDKTQDPACKAIGQLATTILENGFRLFAEKRIIDMTAALFRCARTYNFSPEEIEKVEKIKEEQIKKTKLNDMSFSFN